MNGEEIAKVLTWSDIAIMVLLLSLAITLFIYAWRYLVRRDKQTGLFNRQSTCGLHQWNDNNKYKQMRCQKCGKIPGKDLSPGFQLGGFDGP